MIKMATILEEVNALESSLQKLASEKKGPGNSLPSFLDKIAEEMEDGEDKEKEDDKEKEKEEEANKEGSMKQNTELVDKIANAVIEKLQKIAVLDTAETQGSEVGNTAGGSNDGAATNSARGTDQIIEGAKVESEAASNPNAHNPAHLNGGGDLIVNKAPNVNGMAEPLQKAGHVTYTAAEAEILEKFASIGYEHVVDVYSDQIVQEKVAQAIVAEQAKDAPQKIAQSILAQKKTTKTASNQQTELVEKLAEIKRTNPELFQSLQVLAKNGLI